MLTLLLKNDMHHFTRTICQMCKIWNIWSLYWYHKWKRV